MPERVNLPEHVAHTRPIGVFDSGVGGISVLRALVREMPHERFIYFGDSAHAPYGTKTREEILGYSEAITARFEQLGAKAVVVSCNTATSVAIRELRENHPGIPIIGVEPALKPAVEKHPNGSILVMATPVTLERDKYHELVHRLDKRIAGSYRLYEEACPKLAERIEKGNLDDADLYELVENYIGVYKGKVDAVVLGCTHYPFITHVIKRILGNVDIFDGSEGTARQTRRQLAAYGTPAIEEGPGVVEFESSIDTLDERALYRGLFAMDGTQDLYVL